jgi:FAD-dependent oxidoreductase domain-containing protein 1
MRARHAWCMTPRSRNDADRAGGADAVIIGAGIVGASVAYWLTRLEPSASVALIERDRTFARASSALSASSIRQQFSHPLNIRMSQFGLQFMREMGIAVEEKGYLYLGAAGSLRALNELQCANGADVVLLSPAQLSGRFPWLNVDGIELGSLGLSGEGWFDGPALHAEVLRRARAAGVRLMEGEAQGFEREADGRIRAVLLAGGSRIECGHAVNAAGPWARPLAAAAGVALPVHARRRTVFVLSCPDPLPDCPLVIDPSGFWFRPEGRYFIAGTTPNPDLDDLPLEPNHAEFDEALWARMAHRVPAFAALRVERAWAGYYEMNVFDANAIIGAHPAAPNLWFANGFSGHGMQQAPAAGRGIAELILRGRFETLDLAPLGFRRLIDDRPMVESIIIG